MTEYGVESPAQGESSYPGTDRDMAGDFDITDPVWATPHFEDVLDELVAKCPVSHSSAGTGYRVFNHHRDVRRCGQDWKTFSSAGGYLVNRPEGTPLILPEESDPPYHNEWRKRLNAFFDPKSVKGYEEPMRQVANDLIDAFIERGECEYVADFAAHLPGMVLFRCVIPVPVGDTPMLFEAIDTGTFGPLDERGPAFAVVADYCDKLLRDRAEAGDFVPRRHHRRDRRRGAAARRIAMPLGAQGGDTARRGLRRTGHDNPCHVRGDLSPQYARRRSEGPGRGSSVGPAGHRGVRPVVSAGVRGGAGGETAGRSGWGAPRGGRLGTAELCRSITRPGGDQQRNGTGRSS